jgi:hypothetical protein
MASNITLKTRDVGGFTNVDKLKIDPYIRERMGEPTPIQYAVELDLPNRG